MRQSRNWPHLTNILLVLVSNLALSIILTATFSVHQPIEPLLPLEHKVKAREQTSSKAVERDLDLGEVSGANVSPEAIEADPSA